MIQNLIDAIISRPARAELGPNFESHPGAIRSANATRAAVAISPVRGPSERMHVAGRVGMSRAISERESLQRQGKRLPSSPLIHPSYPGAVSRSRSRSAMNGSAAANRASPLTMADEADQRMVAVTVASCPFATCRTIRATTPFGEW